MKALFAYLTMFLLAPLFALDAADLRVVNGDFSDVSGLKPFGGDGWYQGVPAGWKASSKNPLYSIHKGAEGMQPVCNVSQLGSLEQNVGTLTQPADLVLTMDVADAWHKGAELSAEILDGSGETLRSIMLKPGRGQRLVAGKVPANTSVIFGSRRRTARRRHWTMCLSRPSSPVHKLRRRR